MLQQCSGRGPLLRVLDETTSDEVRELWTELVWLLHRRRWLGGDHEYGLGEGGERGRKREGGKVGKILHCSSSHHTDSVAMVTLTLMGWTSA